MAFGPFSPSLVHDKVTKYGKSGVLSAECFRSDLAPTR